MEGFSSSSCASGLTDYAQQGLGGCSPFHTYANKTLSISYYCEAKFITERKRTGWFKLDNF